MRSQSLFRRFACCLAALLLLPAVPVSAAAEAEIPDAERFSGKDWQEIAEEFFAERSVSLDTVGVAYCNTVTGEEHTINGGRYRFAASVYKLPLNMYYAEKVYLGEMAADARIGGVAYDYIQKMSLEYSNNELSELLRENLGSFPEYKDAIAHLLAADRADMEPGYTEYIYDSAFTPEQILYALKLLYAAPERYPDVLEHMKNAQPHDYFAQDEQRYPIAHKYGANFELNFGAVNDCGVVYTEEPFLLVMLTEHMNGGTGTLSAFCTLMCDYTQHAHAVREAEAAAQAAAEAEAARLAAEEAERARAAEEAAAAAALSEAAVPEPTSPPEPAPEAAPAPETALRYVLWGAAAALALLLLASLIFLKRKPAKWIAAPAAALALVLLLAFLLRAPAGTEPADSAPVSTPGPAPTPTPTPEPTPEPLYRTVLTGESAEEIQALFAHPELKYVDATASAYYDELALLARTLPECVVDYTLDVGGITVRSTDASLVLDAESDIDPETLAQKLACLPWLRTVDICALGWTNEQSLAVVEAFPEKKIVWTVRFAQWAVRSDITCFSTLYGLEPYHTRWNNADFAPLLTYCTDLVALDLGHNNLTDLTPIGKLTKLKVLILGDNPEIADISPLGNLTELEYLEFFMGSEVTDFSCMARLTGMRDLCIGYCPGLTDIGFVADMPELEMGWFPGCGLSAEQRAAALAARPNTTFQFYSPTWSSTGGGWRATERNLAVRQAFRNWENVVAFRAVDDVEYREGAHIVPVEISYE